MSNRRLRLVQFVWSLDPSGQGGGADYYALRLALRLDPVRFDCRVCALWQTHSQLEAAWQMRLRAGDVAVTHLLSRPANRAPGQRLVAFEALVHYIQASQPDIIHCHTGAYDLLIPYLRVRLGHKPFCLRTVHLEREWNFLPVVGWLIEAAYPLIYDQETGVAPQIIARRQRQLLERLLKRRILYTPNGLDAGDLPCPHSTGSLRLNLGLEPEAFLITSVGRLNRQKGYSWLLQAFATFQQRVPLAYLVLVGGGELEVALRNQIRTLGLQSHVFLLGRRPDSQAIIRQCDVLVNSSLWEGFPTALLEAAYLGTPCLVADIPGNRNVVLSTETGLLYPPGDIPAFVQALSWLYEDPAKRRKLAEAAQQEAERFSFLPTVQKFEALYRAVVGY